MMKSKYTVKFFLLSLFIFVLQLSGCDYGKIRQVSTSGELTVETDENIAPVIEKAANEFMRLNKEAKLNLVVKTSNEVIADFINDDCKTVISCRDFSQTEKDIITQSKIDIKKNLFALDGIGIIVNPQNPLRYADMSQIKKIFTGEITDWKEVDVKNTDLQPGKIKVFISRRNSSTHDFFKYNALGGSDFAKTNTVCSTSTQMLEEIRKNKLAIGYVSMSWITKGQDTLDTSVKPLKLAPVDSTGRPYGEYVGFYQAYIADKSYPLVMEAYIFSRDFSMNVSVGFISFMLAYDGQKIILNSGLVPVTQPVKIIQLN